MAEEAEKLGKADMKNKLKGKAPRASKATTAEELDPLPIMSFSVQISDPSPDSVHGVGSLHATDNLNGRLIKGTSYRMGHRIGSGGYGEVYLARDIKTYQKVAVKAEPSKNKTLYLELEWQMYSILQRAPAAGIPKAYHYGQCGLYDTLVMQLLGPSLEQAYKLCGRSFSLHTVLMIAIQLITRIECVHAQNIIHRDIKPDNFLIGTHHNANNTIFIADFGLSKFYIDPLTEKHIPYKEHCVLTGTPRYMSVNVHMGIEPSRRDDLEALGHCLIYFLRGSLPWQGVPISSTKVRYKRLMDMKQSQDYQELCKGNSPEIAMYMDYVRKLGFYQTPDYKYLRSLFIARLESEGLDPNGSMDWNSKIGHKKRSRARQ